MKKLFCCIAALCTLSVVHAQALITPQPSPTQTLKQNFGLTSIELSYSRPGIKGRTLFVDLAPYGMVWRTGANNATTLTFAEDVTIGGKKIPAGKYGFVTIPSKDEWTLILTKQLDITAPEAYKQENDVVRVMAKPIRLNDKVETFTMQFANVKPETCDLQLLWGNTVVTLPISADTDQKIMAQIDNLINKDNKPYYNAAVYYLENGKNLNQAVSWFDKAIEQNPKSFTSYHQKAKALARLNRKDDAKKAANTSLALAKEAKNDTYVELNTSLLEDLK